MGIDPGEHVVCPEDRIFRVLLVSQDSKSSNVQGKSKLRDVLFDIEVKVLSKESLRSHFLGCTNLHNIDDLMVVHVSAVIWDDSNDSLEELLVSSVLKLVLSELLIEVIDRLLHQWRREDSEDPNKISRCVLVNKLQDVLGENVVKSSILIPKSVKSSWDLS